MFLVTLHFVSTQVPKLRSEVARNTQAVDPGYQAVVTATDVILTSVQNDVDLCQMTWICAKWRVFLFFLRSVVCVPPRRAPLIKTTLNYCSAIFVAIARPLRGHCAGHCAAIVPAIALPFLGGFLGFGAPKQRPPFLS